MSDMPRNLPATSDAASLMAVISRAASDTTIDVDKLERLMAMYERITAAQSKAAFDRALAEMQPKLPIVDRRGAITIRDKTTEKNVIQSTPYALFEDINEAIKPFLAEHGFAISFRTSAEAKVKVTAILSHREGHREETSLELMHDSTGSKNAVQAIGSSVQYGKRYTMCAILNISTRGEDDDGHGGDGELVSAEQVAAIEKLLPDAADMTAFLGFMKVAAIGDIHAAKYTAAVQSIEKRKAALAAKAAKK